MNVVFIKFGGSVITDKTKPRSFCGSVVAELAKDLAAIHANDPDTRIIIGTGAGSFGHYVAQKTNYRNDTSNALAAAQVHQSVVDLNAQVVSILQGAGLPAFTLQPSAFLNFDQSASTTIVTGMLDLGIIPVVYGDVLMDGDTTKIASTEWVFNALGEALQPLLHIKKVLFLSNVDGVLDAKGVVIPKVSADSHNGAITKTTGYDVTGGMKQKIEYANKALSFAESVHILSGTKPGAIQRVLENKVEGTVVVKNL